MKDKKTKKMIDIIILVLVFYTAYCATLFITQRRIIFPRHVIPPPPGADKVNVEKEVIWIETGYGKIETWFMPPASGQNSKPAPAVIFAHGNGDLINFWAEDLIAFTKMGIGVLLVEYPGYGRSEGYPSQASITETFIKAYDLLAAREDVDQSKIILFGSSLGGGAVCSLAAERPSSAMILMSTFTSARAFAIRYFAPGFLVRDPFDNLSVVKSYDNPVLILHGQQDDTIPYSHGVTLHQAAKKSDMITYDCSHNNCPPNWQIFWKDIEGFLKKAGII